MKRSRAIVFVIVSLAAIIAVALAFLRNPPATYADIVATNFPCYDFARAVAGDNLTIKMLVSPGAETHDYEPTPADIASIYHAKLFIYIGGESDAWVDRILETNDIPKSHVLRLMDFVTVKVEDSATADSQDSTNPEYDEHIWTSPQNAIIMLGAIANRLASLYPNLASTFATNSATYESCILALDQSFKELVTSTTRRELIFADRFPFRYFTDEYGLTFVAAFPGCAHETEPSPSVIASLINHVKTTAAPVIFKIELSSPALASAVAAETGAKVLTLHSAHNISADDFAAGVTYVDLLSRNLRSLSEALL